MSDFIRGLSVVEADRSEQKGNQMIETEQQTLPPSLQPGEIAAVGQPRDAVDHDHVVGVGGVISHRSLGATKASALRAVQEIASEARTHRP
jgi:hypothetical protein